MQENKLHYNQERLLAHLAQFNLLGYEDCLELLRTPGQTERMDLSYAFRPLTKNGYVSKNKDGCVSILAKGRALLPEITPLISAGGGEQERKRVMQVSRMAMWMAECGFFAGQKPSSMSIVFIPSARWRGIAPGILSTSRFVGMLVGSGQRLAVYDIGDGRLDWQTRAENSLFYTKYGKAETQATGMLLVCQEEKRVEVAQNIIRQTMWHRKQLLKEHCAERNRPTRWSRSPIRLRTQYKHVYLTTRSQMERSIIHIYREKCAIQIQREEAGIEKHVCLPDEADVELWPWRLFFNAATDLLKYVRFFAAVKDDIYMWENAERFQGFKGEVQYELYFRAEDDAIAHMYPDVNEAEGAFFHVCQR